MTLHIEEENLLKAIQYNLQMMDNIVEPNKRIIVQEEDYLIQYRKGFFGNRKEITRTHKDVVIEQFLECNY